MFIFLGTKVMPNLPKQARLGAKRYESGAYFFVMWDKDEVLKKQNERGIEMNRKTCYYGSNTS